MPSGKISDLPAASTVSPVDQVELLQTGVNVRGSLALIAALFRSAVNALTYTLGTAANKDYGTLPGQLVTTDDPQYQNAKQRNDVTFSNASFTIPFSARSVRQIGTMSGAVTVTLPVACQLLAGTEILITDWSGSPSRFNTITIQTATNPITAAQDTLNGVTTNTVKISGAWQGFTLVSDGIAGWRVSDSITNCKAPGDANYTCGITDKFISYEVTLTAVRTLTLPDCTKLPAGYSMTIQDSNSAVNGSNFITIAAFSGQTMNGVASVQITTARGALTIYNAGSSWKFDTSTLGAGMTLLGDTLYGGAAGLRSVLPGNITATKKFLIQTGTGTVSAAPIWGTIALADLPTGTKLLGSTSLGDANYTALASDVCINLTTTLTAGRTITLPDITTLPTGYEITVQDGSSVLGGSFTITVQGTSGQTVNGNSSIVMNIARESITFRSNGSSWKYDGSVLRLATSFFKQATGGTFSNTDFTIPNANRSAFQNGNLSATRTVTLPLAANVSFNQEIVIADVSGSVTTTNKILVVPQGSDTINGSTNPVVIAVPYGNLILFSNGSNQYNYSKSDVHLDMTGKVPSSVLPGSVHPGMQIGGVGDSKTSRCTYQPGNADLSTTPAWTANTAVVASQTMMQNGGLPYVCITSGTTASSGGPTGQGTNITDGTAHWAFRYPIALKIGTSPLTWLEAFSCGRLSFSLANGYAGLANSIVKIIVQNGGTGYTNGDLLVLTGGVGEGGATGTLTIVAGVITAVNITQPGDNGNAGASTEWSITNSVGGASTGSGAILAIVGTPSGTFATQGAWTQDVVAYLPDIVTSGLDICLVEVGTNDVNNNVPYTTIIANLRTIWESIMTGVVSGVTLGAGKRVLVRTVMPKSSTITTAQAATLQRVNRFIRAYHRKEIWANPLGYTIALSDATGIMTDGTSVTNGAVGALTVAYPAVTVDGLHQSTRGAMLQAIEDLQALQRDLGICVYDYTPRVYSANDGYDPSMNPYGNLLEGVPWITGTVYAVGTLCSNAGNIYMVTTGGTSASAPTGTGATITDGTVTWVYAGRTQGLSVFMGTSGTQAAKTGIVYTGSLATGWTITRVSGTGAGTIIQSIENPWSNGIKGQRQATNFSLGGGTNVEHWAIFKSLTCQQLGLVSADFGSSLVYAEWEVEVSALQNCSYLYGALLEPNSNWQTEAGNTLNSGFTGSINNILFSVGEPQAYPNNGRMLFRTEPMLLPSWFTTSTALFIEMYVGFDASGGAGSATGTFKCNYVSIKKYGGA
jgi:hypothetical protein